MGFDPDLGPVIVSILKDRDIHDGSILYLMRRDQVLTAASLYNVHNFVIYPCISNRAQ